MDLEGEAQDEGETTLCVPALCMCFFPWRGVPYCCGDDAVGVLNMNRVGGGVGAVSRSNGGGHGRFLLALSFLGGGWAHLRLLLRPRGPFLLPPFSAES